MLTLTTRNGNSEISITGPTVADVLNLKAALEPSPERQTDSASVECEPIRRAQRGGAREAIAYIREQGRLLIRRDSAGEAATRLLEQVVYNATAVFG